MLGKELKEVRSFQGSELEKEILKPLDSLITNVNKYTVLPIYICNILISKTNYIPKMVLAAYDDKSLITEISASDPSLESILMDKSPDEVVSPTVIVYSNDLPRSSVLFSKDDMYYYSTSYLIYGKGLKELIKEEIIDRVSILTDGVKYFIDFQGNFDSTGVMTRIPDSANVLRLPICNYAIKHPSYKPLFEKISIQNGEIVSDIDYLGKLFNDVKEEQSCNILGTSNILLFKDFMKQKPAALVVYSNKSSDGSSMGVKLSDGMQIVDVALEMSYSGAKVTHFLFYRYIENMVEKIVGNYDEL